MDKIYSIGSLGIGGSEVNVSNIHVERVNFRETTNGARIKTWQVNVEICNQKKKKKFHMFMTLKFPNLYIIICFADRQRSSSKCYFLKHKLDGSGKSNYHRPILL